MAAGKRVLPGAPRAREHDAVGSGYRAAAGRAMTAGQATRAGQAFAAGRPLAAPGVSAGAGWPPGSSWPDGRAWPDGGDGLMLSDEDFSDASSRRRLHRGSGGRWLLWTVRAVAWAALLVIGYRGVVAIVTDETQSARPASGSTAGPGGFPVTLAQAYALDFGQVYLSYGPQTAARRAARLAPFLPTGTSPEFGWNGAGSQTLQSEQVASVTVLSAHSAVVTLLAEVDGTRLIELAVPVYASAGGMIVSGEPSLLPPPSATALPAPGRVLAEPATRRSLATWLPAFLRDYASGSQASLRKLVTSGSQVSGLGRAVTFIGISRISILSAGASATRIVVAVRWSSPSPAAAGSDATQPAAELDMSYQMTLVRHGGSWLVRSIGAAPAQPGLQS
jgi:Conjugative transposon protein TcpC